MAGEIESAFRLFDENTRASTAERARLLAARTAAVDILAGDSRILRVVDVGSYRHATEVGGQSWYDVAVVLTGKPASVGRASEIVASVLGPDAPGSTESGPPESGPTESGPSVRLIPSYEAPATIASGGGDVVLMPDAARRWVPCRIGARETLLNRIDDANLRPLIRLILAWKYRAAVDISSYYLETAVIRQVLQQPSFSVLWDACWSFEAIAADDLMNLTDFSSPAAKQKVRATASLAKRIEAGYPLQAATAAVRTAVNAYLDDDLETVYERLSAVWGPDFPEV